MSNQQLSCNKLTNGEPVQSRGSGRKKTNRRDEIGTRKDNKSKSRKLLLCKDQQN